MEDNKTTKEELLKDLKTFIRDQGRNNIISKRELQEIVTKHEN